MDTVTFHLNDENNDAPIDVQHVVIDDSSMSTLEAHALFSRPNLAKVEFFSLDGDDDGNESRMTHIGDSAFRFCASLGSIYSMPSSLTRIGSWSFASCNQVMYIHLPDGIQSIGEGAFQFCVSLLTIRVPSSVRVLLFSSFRGCKSLRSIELPPTLEMIGSSAFDGCSELVNIFFTKSLAVSGHNLFRGCRKLEWLVRGEVMSESAIVEGIRQRFDGMPVLELCYHQSYHSSDPSLLEMLNDAIIEQYIRFEKYEDLMGMGPLHILALAATPSVSFAQTLVNQVVEETVVLENLNRSKWFGSFLSRFYCCCCCLADDSSQQRSNRNILERHLVVPDGLMWPDNSAHDPLLYACLNMAPGSPHMIQFLYELTALDELAQLGLEQWRKDVRSCLVRELSGEDAGHHHLDHIHNVNESEFEKRMKKIMRVNKCFQTYLLKEKLAILELATWKASIVMEVPKKKKDTKLVSQSHERQDYRTVCGIDVVVSNTMTFLLDSQ